MDDGYTNLYDIALPKHVVDRIVDDRILNDYTTANFGCTIFNYPYSNLYVSCQVYNDNLGMCYHRIEVFERYTNKSLGIIRGNIDQKVMIELKLLCKNAFISNLVRVLFLWNWLLAQHDGFLVSCVTPKKN